MSNDDGLDPELAALLSQNEDAAVETNGVSHDAPEPEAPARRRGPPRRRGKDKGPRVIGRPAPTPESARSEAGSGSGAGSAGSGPAGIEPQSVPPSTEFEGSRDALVVWPKVLEDQLALGFTPDQIAIRVTRVPIGPIELKNVRAQTIDLVPLMGSQVCGDTNQSPSEALFSCIVNDYHLTYTGPAIYKLTFQYRFGKSGNIPGVPANVEIKLDHPTVIKKQLEAKERKAYEDSIRAGAPSGYVPRTPYGHPYYPPPAAQQAPQGQPAPNLSNPAEAELLRKLAEQNGFYRGLLEGQQQAAPASAAPAPAPARDPRLPPEGMTAEEWDGVLAQRQAKAIGPVVVQSMMAMGFTPELLQSLKAMALQGGPAVQGSAALPVAQPTSSDPLAGFKAAISALKEMGSLKKDVAKVLGIELPAEGETAEEKEEDPTVMKPILGGMPFPGTETPMAYGPKLEDETWSEYMVRWGTHNPAAAMAFLEKLQKVVDPKVLSDLVQSIMAKRAAMPTKQIAGPPSSSSQDPPKNQEPKKRGWEPS